MNSNSAPILTLPAFSLFDECTKYPHRHHVEARHEWTNEHGVKFEAEVISNWPRTRWLAYSNMMGGENHFTHPAMRASNMLSTTSQKRAEEWIRACAAGRVSIGKRA
jgi:hypothetical protein